MAITSRIRDYSDLDLDFFPHPVTKDIVKKIGPDAIARAIRNLVFTNFYERKFQHNIGSGARKLLFENITPMTASILENMIEEVVTNFEPRATVVGVEVKADPDNNGYSARIVFTINNRPEPFSVTVFLERVR